MSRFPFRYRKNINIASRVFNFKNKLAVFLVTNPGFLAFWALQIPWPFSVFKDFSFSYHFQKFSQLLLFLVIFSPCLFNYVSLSILDPSTYGFGNPLHAQKSSGSRLISILLCPCFDNLPNITPVFHHSRCLTIKYYDFLGLENEILKFLDFPGFSMTCASPATHMLISSSKRTRRCGLERGTSKLSFPKYVNF